MDLRSDDSGELDPNVELPRFTGRALAALGRESLLNGRAQDRVAQPPVAKRSGEDAYATFAVEAGMGARRIDPLRLQRALGFAGFSQAPAPARERVRCGARSVFERRRSLRD